MLNLKQAFSSYQFIILTLNNKIIEFALQILSRRQLIYLMCSKNKII